MRGGVEGLDLHVGRGGPKDQGYSGCSRAGYGPGEEVVVVGRQPEWRRKIDQEAAWRPEKFKLPENSSPSSRIQWLPEYTEDERNSYQGVRDRTGEKASLKLFEWKF